MNGLFLAFLAVSAAPAEPPVRGSAAIGSKCVEGKPEPSSSSIVRPIQTGRCPYDVHGAYARLTDLLRVREGRVDVEYMERLFGLPRLHTAYDDPRAASYSAFVTGGAGESYWKGLLSFSEGFGPPVETRPIHFQGSMRPRHIRKGERGEIRLSINLFPLAPPQPWKGCVTVEEFEKRALAAGWSPPEEFILPSPHGGPPPLLLERGGQSLSLSSGNAIGCLTEVTLHQEANPPIPPITDAEMEAIRLKSAREMAAHVEGVWLALPATDREDQEARNARAKFMRDWMLSTREGAPPGAGEAAIGSMSVEALREFARDALRPATAWAHRELCDEAVKDPDPPAALARLAAERKLDPAAAQLLYSRCSIYVEGRRFKHRNLPR